eukprot:TRINITY_DN3581_c0_g1_i1.p1 TRINITY_DN3581_c0_g1~~TRINITY_DN3581_c0_g1_i1.p1  ORF type:complete len:446 (-),score=145.59 TRINITY_DN3581_c0_g1_i1:171-1508(-)
MEKLPALIKDQPWYVLAEHGVVVLAAWWAISYVKKTGVKKIVGNVLSGALKAVPGAQGLVAKEIEQEVDKAVRDMFKPDAEVSLTEIPVHGIDKQELLAMMRRLKLGDVQPANGKVFAYVYTPPEHEHQELVEKAFTMFIESNGLSPIAFPSLRRFENEVVAMSRKMFNGDGGVCGTMTSGGTESLLLAVKTYRDRARDLFGITEPEMILPVSVHVAVEKAAKYFGVKSVYVPLGPDMRVDVDAVRRAITRNTVLIIASAPQYPHGVVDPIEEIGAIAQQHKLGFHVDACIGGFMLPWVERLGYPVPKFDFRVPGVTSMSADMHKYGFAAKGASVLLYRNKDIRKYQFFTYSEWPGGLFVSPTMLGTRPGGCIAAAWAAMCAMGQNGYTSLAQGVMETSVYLQNEIAKIPGLYVLGKPHMTIVAFAARDINILAVADVMEEKFGW